jgi:hypothetical protein
MATANISPQGIFTGFDNNGNPLAGGKLFTYLAGSSATKINTYTTASESTANPNPVILDAAGRAQVWLDPSNNYKFVLSPSTDTDPPTNPLWTTDNISPVAVAATASALTPGATITIGGAITVTTPVFTGAGNITGNATIQSALFTNTQGNGTGSGETFSASTWTTRVLNTSNVNTIAGLTLSGNQLVFAPPAVPGTYEAFSTQTLNNQNTAKSRLRNTVGNVTVVDGIAYNSATVLAQGQFALAGNATLALQIFATTSGNLTGGGALGTGDPEVYSSLYVRKIA